MEQNSTETVDLQTVRSLIVDDELGKDNSGNSSDDSILIIS